MNAQTFEIKDGAIILPAKSFKDWQGANVLVSTTKDMIVIKKAQPNNFWQTWERFGQADNKVAKKDIAKAIKWARRSK